MFTAILSAILLCPILTLISYGINLSWGTMRILNIAVGDFAMVSGFITIFAYTLYGISPIISAFLLGLMFFLLGLLIFRLVVKPLHETSETEVDIERRSILIFFGVIMIVINIVFVTGGSRMRSYSFLPGSFNIFGASIAYTWALGAGISAAVSLFVIGLFIFTRYGKKTRALMENRVGAQMVGINPDFIRLISSGLSFMVLGVAGAVLSMLYVFDPFIGLKYTMLAFVIVILGGLGNILRTPIAAFIVPLHFQSWIR